MFHPSQQGLPACSAFSIAAFSGASKRATFPCMAGPCGRLGMSRNKTVVFEVTDDSSYLETSFLAPEEEGFYVVDADGGGLRRVGPASRRPPGRFPARNLFEPSPGFSPDGRRIVFI